MKAGNWPVSVLFIVLVSRGWAVNLESSVGVDGASRYTTKLQYRSAGFNAGIVGRFSPDGSPEYLGGMNLPMVSVGHLGDSGLASELRNPGAAAVSRVSEATRFSADPRSLSRQRIGIALTAKDRNYGVVLEHRNDVDCGIIWGVPLRMEKWTGEAIISYGLDSGDCGSDTWYNEDIESGGGAFALSAARLRFHTQSWIVGITGMVSCGATIRPGTLLALSQRWAKGAWVVRSRAVVNPYWFRNSDGERLNAPLGAAFDLRYRPARGCQLEFDYQGIVEKQAFEPERLSNELAFGLGWKGGGWTLKIKDRILLPIGDYRLTGNVEKTLGPLGLSSSASYTRSGDWWLQCRTEIPFRGRSRIDLLGKLHRESGPLLLDCRLRTYLRIGKNRIICSVTVADIPRDWLANSVSSSDFESELRWIREF